MNNQFKEQEIKWRTTCIYVDLHTGEIIPEETAKERYIVVNKKKHSEKYKKVGTITITYECKPSRNVNNKQGTLW